MLDKYFDKNRTFRPKKKFEAGKFLSDVFHLFHLILTDPFSFFFFLFSRVHAAAAAQKSQGFVGCRGTDQGLGQASAG